MKTRWRSLILGLFAIVAATPLVIVAVVAYPKPGVTPANFYRLHGDMTEEEAEAILGGRADDWIDLPAGRAYVWHGDHCTICLVKCDDYFLAGQLKMDDGSTEQLSARPPQGILDRLRRWIHR
jgi:hypothetical protein